MGRFQRVSSTAIRPTLTRHRPEKVETGGHMSRCASRSAPHRHRLSILRFPCLVLMGCYVRIADTGAWAGMRCHLVPSRQAGPLGSSGIEGRVVCPCVECEPRPRNVLTAALGTTPRIDAEIQ